MIPAASSLCVIESACAGCFDSLSFAVFSFSYC